MASVAASGVGVLQTPSLASQYSTETLNDPMFLLKCFGGHRWYGAQRGDPSSNTYEHRVWFKNDSFTLDGKEWKNAADPENVSFVEKVKSGLLPDEFKGDGVHYVMVECLRDDEEWHGELNTVEVEDDIDDDCGDDDVYVEEAKA